MLSNLGGATSSLTGPTTEASALPAPACAA